MKVTPANTKLVKSDLELLEDVSNQIKSSAIRGVKSAQISVYDLPDLAVSWLQNKLIKRGFEVEHETVKEYINMPQRCIDVITIKW